MKAVGLALFDTAIGSCGIAWTETAIAGIQLPEGDLERTRRRLRRRFADVRELAPPLHVASAVQRITVLLRGESEPLDGLPIALDDLPPFDQRVYAVAQAIRPGRVQTYGDIAAAIGEPGAAREVGAALGRNPFPLIVPCHRVVAAGGRLGGFSAAGGTVTKRRLLEIENARFGSEPDLFG
jgi:methylated-DNA-[protein]-cysteine S-methyltransferase